LTQEQLAVGQVALVELDDDEELVLEELVLEELELEELEHWSIEQLHF
jgi:hypothetical protein